MAGRFRQENGAKLGARTIAMRSEAVSMFGGICTDIAGEPSTITKCGGGKGTNPNGPIDARSVNYISGMAGRLTRLGQITRVKA